MGACNSSKVQASEPSPKGFAQREVSKAEKVAHLDVDKRPRAPTKCVAGSVLDFGVEPGRVKKMVGNIERPGFGCTCTKGKKKVEFPNQDSWSIHSVCDKFSVYGVYDGHGASGHFVSNRAKQIFDQNVNAATSARRIPDQESLKATFRKVQACLDSDARARFSGTTATVVVHDHICKDLTVAHVGDSTAVLGRHSCKISGGLEAVKLTRDHHPCVPEEQGRIVRAGGRVESDGYCSRVYKRGTTSPGLNVSRSIGDIFGHQACGVSAEPEVTAHHITPEDQVLLVCSDGVWEVITPQEAVDMVEEFSPDCAQEAAEHLAAEARSRWMSGTNGTTCDDITVVLTYLQASDLQQAVSDGVPYEIYGKPTQARRGRLLTASTRVPSDMSRCDSEGSYFTV